ncbi:MAG TPA: PQQ-binding-like beta-propeller repeat protein [Methylomirabilota bacterium]|nr:PQQ-binding-like beta-propeller repeat protein [Methylomirabilota bacterium]
MSVPLHWSPTNAIKWKTAIPGQGWSSPVVWGDHIFVTSATDGGTKCHVICIDRPSGKIIWDKEVFEQVPLRKEGKNSYATPTPATDGESVFAVFGDGSVVALDFSGKVRWTNRDVKFYSQHGLGASPMLWNDLLIMPYDGSSQGEDKRVGWQKPWDQSFVLALDLKTGTQRWKASRGMSRIAHVSPILFKSKEVWQIISAAGDVVQAFDPRTGNRIWSAFSQGEGVVPSPVASSNLIYTASGFEKSTIRAIKAGGSGDVTQTHIAWEQRKAVPSMPSFVYADPHLYSITEGGVAQCLKGDTGEIVWQERIGGNHSASPVLAEGRIYFLSEEGESAVIAAAPEFKLLARNSIGERCQASIAVSSGMIFIRGEKHLFAISR